MSAEFLLPGQAYPLFGSNDFFIKFSAFSVDSGSQPWHRVGGFENQLLVPPQRLACTEVTGRVEAPPGLQRLPLSLGPEARRPVPVVPSRGVSSQDAH